MNAAIPTGKNLAIAAETLYLVNLMLAPGIGFLALLVIFLRHGKKAPRLARDHLRQTFWVSLWGGAAIVAVTGAAVFLGGRARWTESGALWTGVVLYFTCVHSTLVLLGVVGLARALAGQSFRYPVIGPRLVT